LLDWLPPDHLGGKSRQFLPRKHPAEILALGPSCASHRSRQAPLAVRADAREGDIGMQLGEIAKAIPEVAIGSYPFFDPQHGRNTKCGAARPRCTEARAGQK